MDASSHLLRALSQLNDTAWVKHLLPKLRRDGSAGNFALTCKELQRLCMQNQRTIKLQGGVQASLVAKIPQTFPSLAHLAFRVASCDDAMLFTGGLPHLARLPQLFALELTVTDREAGMPYGFAGVLEAVHLQLSGLKRLRLSINSNWEAADWAWGALGRASRLTNLQVTFSKHCYATMAHLAALANLSQLSVLKITLEGVRGTQHYSFLSGLTTLTRLFLSLSAAREGLATISSCSNLKHLAFYGEALPSVAATLAEPELAAIGKLVQLTQLDIRLHGALGGSPHFLSALQSLPQLKTLTVYRGLTPASLPALASMTTLSMLTAQWEGDGQLAAAAAPGVQCNSLARMQGFGSVPFAAFPQLKHYTQLASWQPASCRSMAQHCKQLLEVQAARDSKRASWSRTAPAAERTAAIRALASLNHLTALSFSVNDDAELTALAAVKQLERLHLILPPKSSCTLGGLQLMMQLRSVKSMQLDLDHINFSQHEAQLVLCGLQHVKAVHVQVPPRQLAVFAAALAAADAATISRPAKVELTALK